MFFMLANPHGYTSLGITREELMDLDLQTYLFYYEKLCEQRQRESDEYEKMRAKAK